MTTSEDGTVTFENLVFGVTYVWKETKAPKGYLLNADNTGIWSVEEHDAEIQYTAKDDRRPGSITVTKQNTDGQPLFGATFLLEYKDSDTKLADLNRELRQVRKQIKMCEEIRAQAAAMQENIREIEHPELEVKKHDKQR